MRASLGLVDDVGLATRGATRAASMNASSCDRSTLIWVIIFVPSHVPRVRSIVGVMVVDVRSRQRESNQ
jgi:hypothetical protein